MMQKIICAVNTTDNLILQQYINRLLFAGVNPNDLKSSGKYTYLELAWDDTNNPVSALQKQTHNKPGAKPKKLAYDGKDVTCGLVWQLRNEGNLSDAEIGLILDASESTIARRRKRHLADGSFYAGSAVIF